MGGVENLLDIQVSICYILKHLEDREAWSVNIYYTWCHIIFIFKLHRRTRFTPRSSIHSLKIRMTSHLCNKYEQIMLSYFLSVNYKETFINYEGLFRAGIHKPTGPYAQSSRICDTAQQALYISTRPVNKNFNEYEEYLPLGWRSSIKAKRWCHHNRRSFTWRWSSLIQIVTFGLEKE